MAEIHMHINCAASILYLEKNKCDCW